MGARGKLNMKNNILFILTIVGIIVIYVICYKLFTESLTQLTTDMIQQTYTIEVKDENDYFINK